MKQRLYRYEVLRLHRKVKLSVPLMPAGASLDEVKLHAPKVCLSCRKAHLVSKIKSTPYGVLFVLARVDKKDAVIIFTFSIY